MNYIKNVNDLASRIVYKMAKRRRLGRFDFSSDSYDMRVAYARACRLYLRIKHGQRTSLQDHLV